MSVASPSKPQIIMHLEQSIMFTVYDTKWIPRSARFAVLGAYPRGTGCLCIYSLNKGKMELQAEIEKPHPLKCGTFAASAVEERRLATGDFSGRMSIWDLERPDIAVYSVAAHREIVNAIDGCAGLGIGQGAPELVTGSRDGRVKVWDPRQADAPVAVLEPAEGETARDCWTVCFGNSFSQDDRWVAAGYDNGDVKVLDLRMNRLAWETNVKNGVCDVQFDRKEIEANKLVVCTLEGKMRVYDMRTFSEEYGYAHVTHKEQDSTVCDYPLKRSVLDESGKAKGVPGEVSVLNTLVASTQPIASFDWSLDKTGLAVMGSFDQTVRVALVTKLETL